jgi:hypothetical protein
MAIATIDQYVAANKQRIRWLKTASRTVVAGIPFSLFDIAGLPGAGTLAGAATGTSTPIMPTDATTGCPVIDFTTGTGYLTRVEFGSTVASRFMIYDMLSKSGAYAYNSGTSTITNVLDISSRCPDYSGGGDTNYGVGNEIWIEIVTAMTSATAWQVQVTYYDQAGNLHTSIVSPGQAAAALTVGKMFMLGLAAGDTGVQSIKSVIVTTGAAAAGSFNVLILRPIYTNMRAAVAGGGDVHDLIRTGMPRVYPDSALIVQMSADSTASGIPDMIMEISNG